jgi:hypothetical protein
MSKDRVIYLPLGGAGEIGMNAYVYGYGAPGKERLILVDLGVTFPDMDGSPGVDLIFPDIAWLEERATGSRRCSSPMRMRITWARWRIYYDRLGAPIYARAFTANIARRKMDEHGHPEKAVADGQRMARNGRGGALYRGVCADFAFHPRKLRPRDRHARRAGGAFGRFQGGSRAGGGRAL